MNYDEWMKSVPQSTTHHRLPLPINFAATVPDDELTAFIVRAPTPSKDDADPLPTPESPPTHHML